ncbi:MAG: SGNH/GDSL hydrolase family protein, partial [Candidatus Electrothrix sp. AR1]|nr:SGNH/GDSL hydrolase family protein [Candidatus Electrothrix sp. AR1]
MLQEHKDIFRFLRNPLKGKEGGGKLPEKEQEGYISSTSSIVDRIDLFSKNGIALGNTPYDQKIAEKNSLVEKKKQRENNQGDLKKTGKIYSRMLRSGLYNPWDPVNYISPRKIETDPALKAFVNQYALDQVETSFDDLGFRRTIPYIDSEKVIIVLGDSVAYGMSLNDNETLSSQLQQHFRQIRFINDGVGGGTPLALRKRLKRHLDMFADKVVGLIYIQTETDYNKNNTPETILRPLAGVLAHFPQVKYRALVHQAYIYQTMPDLIRGRFSFDFGGTKKWRGRDEDDLLRFDQLKKEMLQLAADLGFITVDFEKIVQMYRKEKGTPFAGFSLYVDHCHF